MTNIIKNNSEGYGYKYAALSDIASQGIEIPVMKTGTEPINGKDYIYFFDKETKEWIRGAEIVVLHNKGMNEAQNYASSVTYARRVTTQMAKQLACTDDELIEDTTNDGELEKTQISEGQIKLIYENGSLISGELKNKKVYKLEDIKRLSQKEASDLCKIIAERKVKQNV